MIGTNFMGNLCLLSLLLSSSSSLLLLLLLLLLLSLLSYHYYYYYYYCYYHYLIIVYDNIAMWLVQHWLWLSSSRETETFSPLSYERNPLVPRIVYTPRKTSKLPITEFIWGKTTKTISYKRAVKRCGLHFIVVCHASWNYSRYIFLHLVSNDFLIFYQLNACHNNTKQRYELYPLHNPYKTYVVKINLFLSRTPLPRQSRLAGVR